jgi:hypothetical protein
MNINTSDPKEGSEITKEIFKAKDRIVNYLKIRIAEITNSIQGESPDEKNGYSKDYYSAKDYRDQLNRFLEIVESTATKAETFDSVESFVQTFCQQIQNFPKESYEQLIKFIEETFSFKVKPLSGPPIRYTAWLNYYAQKHGVTPEQVEEIMPYGIFKNFEQKDDTAARSKFVSERIKSVMDQ